MRFSTLRAVLALHLTTLASAVNLVINNHCHETLTFNSVGEHRQKTFDLRGGNTEVLRLWEDEGVSIKISRPGSHNGGILQFEYNVRDNFYWDLSDIDGAGNGKVGSVFFAEHVRVTPTGPGANQGANKCYTLDCPAGHSCEEDIYQYPEQEGTRVCPRHTGDMIFDLCLGEGGEDVESVPEYEPEEEEQNEEEEEEDGEKEWEKEEEEEEEEEEKKHEKKPKYKKPHHHHGPPRKMVRGLRMA